MNKESVKAFYSEPANVREYYNSELDSLKWNGNGQGISLCPFHDDSKESLSVKDSGAYFCHACNSKGGDIISFHMARHTVDFKVALNQLAGKAGIDDRESKKKQISLADIQKITFDGYSFDRLHTYKAGNPPYIKVIFKNSAGDKKGLFYSVTDNGLYVSGRKSEPVFYNQERITDNVKSVFISESEKDCDTLLNVCNFLCISTGGATSWSDKLPREILKDKAIILLSHNDPPGREYTEAAAQSLRSIASSIKIIELPGLKEKGDVSDWIEARQAEGKPAEVIKAELRAIVKAASEWTAPEATAPAEGKRRLKITGIADMLNSEPVKYLIDKILIKDTLTMLSAYAATGKSILSLAIAKAILTGDNLFDSLSVSETGPVLVIDEENPAAFIKERLEGFGFTADMQLHFLHYQGIKLDNASLFNELAEVIGKIRPKLIIIDSLIRIHSQKENEAGMSSVMGKLRELVQTGATVLVIHHHRKGAGDIKEGIRGHSDIIGGVDMAITLEQKDDYLLLSHAKSRTVSHKPIRLELQTSGGILSYKCHGNENSDIIEVILSLLKEHPEGMKQTEILEAIKETGDLDYGDKKIRQTLRSGEAVYWDSQKGGHTGKAIIYRVENVMRQCGGGIYTETLPHYKKDPATLEGNEPLQTLDNTKCGNAAESIKNIATLNDTPANSKKDPATLETDIVDLEFAEILP